MKFKLTTYVLAILLIGISCSDDYPSADFNKIRLSWTDDPSTTITIGWDQLNSEESTVYYGLEDEGQSWNRYKHSQKPARKFQHQNMNTHFCELKGLNPNSAYYFVIKDNTGVSERF